MLLWINFCDTVMQPSAGRGKWYTLSVPFFIVYWSIGPGAQLEQTELVAVISRMLCLFPVAEDLPHSLYNTIHWRNKGLFFDVNMFKWALILREREKEIQ